MYPPSTPPCCPLEAAAPPPSLAEVLERFEREAEFGTHATGRYQCRYVAWGAGPPLVFVHGLSDDARSFVAPMARLSRQFRCVAYDLPTGRDDGARLSRYRSEDYLADLLELLTHLNISRAYLYGSSFGATIVLRALHAQRARFPRAVLQGGFARRRLAPAEFLLCRLARHWPGRMGRLPLRRTILRHSHFGAFADSDPEAWDYFMQRCNAPPIAAVAQRALTVHATDLRPLLPEIQQPVLLVCGEVDPLVNRACAEDLLRGLPHASRAELHGCGHYPYFSHPNVLAEVIERFLLPSSQAQPTPVCCEAPSPGAQAFPS